MVGDLVIKNVALLFKWWWRFSNKGLPLWKRVVCSNHEIVPVASIQSFSPSNPSRIWNQISDFSSFGNTCQDFVQQGLRRKVGYGDYKKF